MSTLAFELYAAELDPGKEAESCRFVFIVGRLTHSSPSHLVLDEFPRGAKSESRRGPMYAWGEGLYADFVQLGSETRWEGETSFATKGLVLTHQNLNDSRRIRQVA